MNKKRLVSMLLVSAMTAALFTGCGSDGNQTSGDSTTSAGTNSTTEEAGIKEFTAFFGVAGSEINDDNEVQQLIAEKVGAKVKETWLTGQTADEAVGTMIAGRKSIIIQGPLAESIPVCQGFKLIVRYGS